MPDEIDENLHYFSKGLGYPVVFQHGLTADSSQISRLLGSVSNIKLVSMDCPGHGNSILEKGKEISFNKYTDLLVKLMRHLGIEKAIIGGLSMGSGIAINMALRYPGLVSGLILLRPAWLDSSSPDNLAIIQKATEYINKPNGKSNFEKLDEFKRMKADVSAAAESVLGVFNPQQQNVLPHVINSMVGDCPFKKMEDLYNINVPCLILANDDDPLHPYFMARRLYSKLKGANLKKVTSRYINADLYKEQVARSVEDFLNDIEL